jgi:hypothetical protein
LFVLEESHQVTPDSAKDGTYAVRFGVQFATQAVLRAWLLPRDPSIATRSVWLVNRQRPQHYNFVSNNAQQHLCNKFSTANSYRLASTSHMTAAPQVICYRCQPNRASYLLHGIQRAINPITSNAMAGAACIPGPKGVGTTAHIVLIGYFFDTLEM